MPAMVDAPTIYQSSRGQRCDDSGSYYGGSKLNSKARGLQENSALKPFVPDKEKASNVAKIKVVVCLGCLFLLKKKLWSRIYCLITSIFPLVPDRRYLLISAMKSFRHLFNNRHSY